MNYERYYEGAYVDYIFHLKFDLFETWEELYSEVMDFIAQYNEIPGDQIIAVKPGYDGDDFMQNKITMRFYVIY